jgi:hypothetical protein
VFESYLTLDPLNDEVFSMKDLLSQAKEDRKTRAEFEHNLYDSVRGIKQLIVGLKKQREGPAKGKKTVKFEASDEESIFKTKIKVNDLMNELQESLSQMNDQFKVEAAECVHHINYHKQNIQYYIGYDESAVRGFDQDLEVSVDDLDDGLDQLDVYADFLGKNEYFKMKENFQKALHVMTELFKVERERLHMNAPTTHAELSQQYDADILNRFQAVHELYQKNGKTREKYQ